MINYIWLGLIVVAIIFGGYMSISDRPIKDTPDPTVLEDFDEKTGEGEEKAPAISTLPFDSEQIGRAHV